MTKKSSWARAAVSWHVRGRVVEKAIQVARPDTGIETRIIATQGDKATRLEPLAGRKGLFTAEIERALLVILSILRSTAQKIFPVK